MAHTDLKSGTKQVEAAALTIAKEEPTLGTATCHSCTSTPTTGLYHLPLSSLTVRPVKFSVCGRWLSRSRWLEERVMTLILTVENHSFMPSSGGGGKDQSKNGGSELVGTITLLLRWALSWVAVSKSCESQTCR